jgi:hypothetical protein
LPSIWKAIQLQNAAPSVYLLVVDFTHTSVNNSHFPYNTDPGKVASVLIFHDELLGNFKEIHMRGMASETRKENNTVNKYYIIAVVPVSQMVVWLYTSFPKGPQA